MQTLRDVDFVGLAFVFSLLYLWGRKILERIVSKHARGGFCAHTTYFWPDFHFILSAVNHVLHLVSRLSTGTSVAPLGKCERNPLTLRVLTFPAERGLVEVKVGCSQLLSRLSSNQLSPQRHSPILNFPIKSNPWHTLATPDTASRERGRSEWTQITPAEFFFL